MNNPIISKLIPVVTIVAVVAIVIVVLLLIAKSMYKVASIDKALIITGGKKPKIIISGGAFVIPIIQKADTFDLCMITVRADKDEILTSTAVPIVADWTAQIRPDVRDEQKLVTAIRSFKERGKEGIINDVKLTLMGAVRDVVASMTPEQILTDKEKFKQEVESNVSDEMDKMGLELVSLNIQDVSDNNGYYENIASIDAADKQQAADIKAARVDRETREKTAIESQSAEIAEANARRESALAKMDAEQIEAEKRKDTDIKKAQYQTETDTAQANAEVAKELQLTLRQQEVEQRKGEVEVMKQEQANLAAQKEREVKITRAEAEKETMKISAQADADVKAIEAATSIKVAESNANAKRQEAKGVADVETTQADARVAVAERDANAIKKKSEAEAAKIKATGHADAEIAKAKAEAEADGKRANLLAEAEGAKAKMLAEAEGIKAKKLAEAEGERALAEARSANDKVNYEIESLKIKTEAQIQIATKTAEIMANIGQNAEFVNIGGGIIPGTNGSGSGNVLIDTLSQIPGLMKILNTENQALNGRNVTDEVKNLSDSALSGLSALHSTSSSSSSAVDETLK